MQTNREKNLEHDRVRQMAVRPKQPDYDFKPLEAVVRQWIAERKDKEQS